MGKKEITVSEEEAKEIGQDNFTKEELTALLTLLARVDIKGSEAPSFMSLVAKINRLKGE